MKQLQEDVEFISRNKTIRYFRDKIKIYIFSPKSEKKKLTVVVTVQFNSSAESSQSL